MNLIISLIGVLLPSYLLLKYFYKKDLNPEPTGVISSTFFKGILSVIPVLIVAIPLGYINAFRVNPFSSAFYTAFVLAAIPEEYFKYRVVTRYCVKQKAFDEPMDGIVYGVTASLGFATLENILYIIDGGLGVALMRAFTAVPAHASWGAIMGYFIGQAKFDKKHRTSVYFGLFVTIMLHGLYDLPLMYIGELDLILGPHDITDKEVYGILFFLGIFIFSVAWAFSLAKRLRKRQDEHKSQIL